MTRRLSKQELIEAVRDRVIDARPEIRKADVEAVVDGLLETLRAEVAAGHTIPLPGFGIFELKETAARTGRNPQSGETLNIPASKSVRFKVAAPFKAQLKGG